MKYIRDSGFGFGSSHRVQVQVQVQVQVVQCHKHCAYYFVGKKFSKMQKCARPAKDIIVVRAIA